MSKQYRQPLIGRRLFGLRKHLRLSRAELSKLTGVTESAIVRLENGHDVRLSTYLPIVEYMLAHAHQSWLAAERFLLLTPAERTQLLAALHEDVDSSGDGRE